MLWPRAAWGLAWAASLLCPHCCISWAPSRREAASYAAGSPIPDPTDKLEFTQSVDHFNDLEKRTFKQRYFVYDTVYLHGGPLFFYTGNEGPLESFYYNTGLPFGWAQEFGALVVFGEHRYYGQSLPFGNVSSFEPTANLAYLSISQALADYALLVSHLKAQYGFSSVVAFGGSYGGMLSAWARIKYPNIFDMALAASAPLPQGFNLIADKNTFYRAVTDDAEKADPACPGAVRAGFAAAIKAFDTAEGRATITKAFNLCQAKPLGKDEQEHFLQYARNAWTEMAMCNYPYASSFLAPLPAWPIAVACQKVLSAATPLEGLAAATAMPYQDPKSASKCLDMYEIFVQCADQTGCGTGLSARAWDYQMCTEIFYEQVTTNVTDMFPARNWTLDDLNRYCSKYSIVPNTNFDKIHFGVDSSNVYDMAKITSKIVFSNGLLDPWHPGGYLEDQGPLLPAVTIELGAHHLDLRAAQADDPQCVIDARSKEKAYINQWLAEGSSLCSAPGTTTPSPPLGGGDSGVAPFAVVLIVICSMALAASLSAYVTWKMTLARPRGASTESGQDGWPTAAAVQLNHNPTGRAPA